MKALVLAVVMGVVLAPMTVVAERDPMNVDLEKAMLSIGDFYRLQLAMAGDMYVDPDVVIVEEDAEPDFLENCGPVRVGVVAFYCPLVRTIVIERHPDLPKIIPDDRVMPFVLAHEWGHYIQDQYLGLKVYGADTHTDAGMDTIYGVNLELMADCLAGAWLSYEDAKIGPGVDTEVVATALMVSSLVGDTASIYPGAHGTDVQRIAAVLSGYDKGILGCMTIDPLVD